MNSIISSCAEFALGTGAMKKFALQLVVGFTALILGASCSIVNSPIPNPTSTLKVTLTTPTPINPILTNLIGDLFQSPDRAGERVEIIGYFRGWDLLDEMDASPPVTRSDWVIADNSGAIYVTGQMPENLDPSSIKQAQQVLSLVATIRVKGDQVYLEAQSVELLPEQ